MKVLFVSDMPINKSVSSGNTFLNFFEGIEGIEMSSIQTRKGLPDISINKAFCVDEKQIVKKLFKWNNPVGKEITKRYNGENAKESGVARVALRKRWSIFFLIQNLIWCLPFWKSKQLKKFIDEVNPDIIFTKLKRLTPLNKLIKYVVTTSKKPLFLCAWDDNYSFSSSKSLFQKLLQLNSRKHMRKTVELADKFYVISKIQQQAFQKWFNKPCEILTKSADFSDEPFIKKEYGKPLQLVYTGNVLLNRWRSLELIANALKNINKDGIKAQLRIYTGNALTNEMSNALNKGESSIVMGSVPSSEVAKIQSNADILVHVEGLDEKSKSLVRYSFSTKVVDYLKMARPILMVGPRGVASIEHLIENDCAIYADNQKDIEKQLSKAIENYELLNELSLKSYNCGKLKHDDSVMRSKLVEEISLVLKR